MRMTVAGAAALVLLVGWVASVGIRAWKGVDVDVVTEMIGAGMASAMLFAKLGGKSGDGGGDTP